MAAYLLRRLVQSALILLGVSFITFFLLYVLPADPVRQIAGRSATPETVENIRQQLGLDQPFIVQYGRYLGGLVQGDMGRSYLQKTEVAELIWSRLPATLLLMAGGDRLRAAARPDAWASPPRCGAGRAVDQVLMITSFVTVSAPQFVVSLLLLYVFAVQARLVPDRRLRHVCASGAACHDLGHPRVGLVCAHDALVDDRRAARRITSAPPAPRG